MRPVSGARDSSGGHDRGELVIFALLALLSVWVPAWLIGHALAHGETWTGADGLHASDQLQYLAWIRDAGQHVLISNLFELRPTAASFLHPGFLLSGVITDLGVSPTVAYLLWAPVALVAIFLAVRAYVHRHIVTVFERRVALILALFFVPTAAFLISIFGGSALTRLYLLGIEVEMWPGTWLWGYSFTVLAVAAIPAALLLYERDRRTRRVGAVAPTIALLCSWFQPWQGATLIGILVASELLIAVSGRAGRSGWTARGPSIATPDAGARLFPLLPVNLIAAAAPLLYYALLARFDPSWALAGKVNRIAAWPLWTLAASMSPLAIPAAFAYRSPRLTFHDLALRTWPLVALGLYWLTAYTHVGTFPIHYFQGLTIPLAILAVLGAGQWVQAPTRLSRAAAVCVVAALTVPALVWKLNDARRSTSQTAVVFPGAPPNAYFLTAGEAAALRFIAHDPVPGGALATSYLGEVIPEETGRTTWLGLPSWTPDYVSRSSEAEQLFSGRMTSADAIAFVRSTGARYVIADCQHHPDLPRLLGPIVVSARRFGCTTVVQVKSA
jgi:hypothetical protein